MGDDRLVARVRAGDDAAFEIIYDRYYRGLLAFCGHMLGSRQEAEDALQHSFASAYRALRGGAGDIELRPWLYTIARNRCLSALRAQRAQVSADGLAADVGSFEGMSAQVQLRADLRELVEELQRLPDDQRAALVLFELGDESHAQIAAVLGVRREKVKALVFQAREALMRARDARATPCVEIREQLATVAGRVPRRSMARRHIDRCPGCAEFEREVRRQRAALAAILPLVPTVGLKASVLGFALGGGGAVALGGAGAGGGATVAAGGVLAAGGVGGGGVGVAGSAGAAAAGAIGTAGAASVATGLATGGGGVGLASLPAKGVVAKILSVVALGGGGAQAQVHSERPPQSAGDPPARVAPPSRRRAPVLSAGARRGACRRPRRAGPGDGRRPAGRGRARGLGGAARVGAATRAPRTRRPPTPRHAGVVGAPSSSAAPAPPAAAAGPERPARGDAGGRRRDASDAARERRRRAAGARRSTPPPRAPVHTDRDAGAPSDPPLPPRRTAPQRPPLPPGGRRRGGAAAAPAAAPRPDRPRRAAMHDPPLPTTRGDDVTTVNGNEVDRSAEVLGRLFDVRDVRAVVTGAASGLGFAMAEVLADCGARVTLADIDARPPGGVHGAAGRARRPGALRGRRRLRRRSGAGPLRRRRRRRRRRVDVVFANAGIGASPGFAVDGGQHIDSIERSDWDQRDRREPQRHHVHHRERGGRHEAPGLRTDRRDLVGRGPAPRAGRLLRLHRRARRPSSTSCARRRSTSLRTASASTRSARARSRARGSAAGATLDPDPETERQWASARSRCGGWQKLEEMKGLVLLLASPAGSFMTGAAYVIDGGALVAAP